MWAYSKKKERYCDFDCNSTQTTSSRILLVFQFNLLLLDFCFICYGLLNVIFFCFDLTQLTSNCQTWLKMLGSPDKNKRHGHPSQNVFSQNSSKCLSPGFFWRNSEGQVYSQHFTHNKKKAVWFDVGKSRTFNCVLGTLPHFWEKWWTPCGGRVGMYDPSLPSVPWNQADYCKHRQCGKANVHKGLFLATIVQEIVGWTINKEVCCSDGVTYLTW